MEIQPNGTILIRASQDGGFVRVQSVTGPRPDLSYHPYRPKPSRRVSSGFPIDTGTGDFTPAIEPQYKGDLDPTLATKQLRIHQENRALQKAENITFQTAWQRLQSTRPELFQGMEPRVIHPD